MTPDQIIAEWIAAYAVAYPDSRPRTMVYKNGWYKVRFKNFADNNMRKKDVLYAAEYWRKLAAANPANQPSHNQPPVLD